VFLKRNLCWFGGALTGDVGHMVGRCRRILRILTIVAACVLAVAAIEEVPFSTLDPAQRNQVRPAGHSPLDSGACPTFLTTPRRRVPRLPQNGRKGTAVLVWLAR
jgi:hypothetical protein